MATLRLARGKGFEDVIFTDPETGLVLEGATSTVVAVRGDKLRTPAGKGILPGTTQAALSSTPRKGLSAARPRRSPRIPGAL